MEQYKRGQFKKVSDIEQKPTQKKSKKNLILFLVLLGAGVGAFAYEVYTLYKIEKQRQEEEEFATNDHKPLIYLYPTTQQLINVKLGHPQNLTHTYPVYKQSGWQVVAEPNGTLIDPQTNRSYYGLYWEGKNTVPPNLKEGFVIEGKNTIPFLEEKLSQLGLTEKEANEFIIYWLPKMETAPYNFVRFQTMQEQNQNMPLEITPNPDTIIRVLMEFKNLSAPIRVQEQILPPTPVRNGFVAVEWGGTDLNEAILK